MKRILSIVLIALAMTACEQVSTLISNAENIRGLKEALTIGSSNAATLLGQKDGYLGNPAVKILLPEEAQTTFKALKVIQEISEIPILGSAIEELVGINLKGDFENVLITAINRSAEDAAPKAINIFVDAITGMSITDATNILFTSNHTAATEYLHTNTYGSLQTTFGDVINESLKNVEVSGYTALDAWGFFAEQNNQLVGLINNPTIQQVLGTASTLGIDVSAINSIKEVETNLGNYTTGKALDGLFLKVGHEEEKIRTDVNARTTELLKRVFGQLD